MKVYLIFIWIYAAMIAMSFWESYVEGRNVWDKMKKGWKIRFSGRYCLPAYHFYVFFVMWPLLLTLPFVICGWNFKLFGILLSAYISGAALEDFMYFVVNPSIKFSEFNSKFVYYYPWLKIGRFEIPLPYITAVIISFLSWYFIWA